MSAADTNILIYAQDSREPTKREIAKNLIPTLIDGVLLWQVACEYIAASRKLEPFGYSREKAFADLRDLQKVWKLITPDWKVLERAESLMSKYSVSFWDALIVAACLENGVMRLYSEDMSDSFRSESLEIINPFQSK